MQITVTIKVDLCFALDDCMNIFQSKDFDHSVIKVLPFSLDICEIVKSAML